MDKTRSAPTLGMRVKESRPLRNRVTIPRDHYKAGYSSYNGYKGRERGYNAANTESAGSAHKDHSHLEYYTCYKKGYILPNCPNQDLGRKNTLALNNVPVR